MDREMKMRDLRLEHRIERTNYGGKQTVKLGNGAKGSDHTLDRTESQAKLHVISPVFAAVSDPKTRRLLERNFDEKDLLPLIYIVSQRIKKLYHPDGDRNIVIEVAADFILEGETVFGHCWNNPLLEIEIKKGAANHEEAREILARESAHLSRHFNLEPFDLSNPALAYPSLEEAFASKENRRALGRMRSTTDWYSTPERREKWAAGPVLRVAQI